MLIKIYDLFGNDIIHRETARKIVQMLANTPDNDQVIVDFDRVEFASRSFLHELITNLCDRKMRLVNLNNDLEQMIKIVINNSFVNSKVATKHGCVYTL